VDPWWNPAEKVLHVDIKLLESADFWPKIVAVVLVARRMLQYSDTRWGRSGKSGRLFLRNVGTVFDDAVKNVLDDPTYSNAYISGCPEFSDHEVRRFLGTVVCSSVPCEFFIIEMLKEPSGIHWDLIFNYQRPPVPISPPGRGGGAGCPARRGACTGEILMPYVNYNCN